MHKFEKLQNLCRIENLLKYCVKPAIEAKITTNFIT